MALYRLFLLPLLLLSLIGCRHHEGESAVSYQDFVSSLANPDVFCRLDANSSLLQSSADPTGGNDDFNHYLREGPDGWVILADLKGPGFLSRFWITGGLDLDQRLRFYFDGEKTPRIDCSVAQLRNYGEPFVLPLAAYEQSCWYNFVPLTYKKRLVIMADRAGTLNGHRLFYQANYVSLSHSVESFPTEITSGDQAALNKFSANWINLLALGRPLALVTNEATVTLSSGEIKDVLTMGGPAIIRELALGINFSLIESFAQRDDCLENLILRIYWDDATVPSIEVPVGQFFGSFQRRSRFNAACFGMSGDTFYFRLPMPFEKGARLALENKSRRTLVVELTVASEKMAALLPNYGYLHAAWNRTLPSEIGRPHEVLHTVGRGRYVGCALAAMSFDKSWWLLESDESIRKDEEAKPGWNGTGLEDYFNGAWYYKNNLVRPLHGLIFKAPFRTVQFRIHRNDAVNYQSSLDVLFERGPDQGSHGLMESVAYYYQEKPQAGASHIEKLGQAPALRDPVEPVAIMTELGNYERFGDYKGEDEYLAAYLERYADVPFAPLLRLRQIACEERISGPDMAMPMYKAFAEATTNVAARHYGRLLSWYNEGLTNALLSLYCSNPAKIYLDGEVIGSVGNPAEFAVFPVQITSGKHVLAIESTRKQYPEWVQACLRTHGGNLMTDGDWRFNFDPAGNWGAVNYDANSWALTADALVEGPPIVPYIWTEPHPFVDMQAWPLGIWVAKDWPAGAKKAVFRKSFVVQNGHLFIMD